MIVYSNQYWSALLAPGTGSGHLLQNVGTTTIASLPAWTAATYPTNANPNQIIYASATNVFSQSASLTFDGNTLQSLSTAAAQLRAQYDSSDYFTIQAGSDGSTTLSAIGTVGNIILRPTGTGTPAMLSDTGIMIFGANGQPTNGLLQIDFYTTTNQVNVTSPSGVTNVNFGAIGISTTGKIKSGVTPVADGTYNFDGSAAGQCRA